MKIFHGCFLLPCLIDAAFNKFPELLVNNLVDYTDITCDGYLGVEGLDDADTNNRKMRNIRIKMTETFLGLYEEDVWSKLFMMVMQNAKALIVVRNDNETG